MSDCKDCNCEMKYINLLFNNNIGNTKNILCKKNTTNYKFLLPFELIFYLTSFSLLNYYKNENKNKNKNKKFLYINE